MSSSISTGCCGTVRCRSRGRSRRSPRLIAAGHPVLFATNNSSAPLGEQEARLERLGIEARGRVISSATAAGSLVEPGDRVFVLGGPGIVEAIEARGATSVAVGPVEQRAAEVDVVVVGLDFQLSYERLRMAVVAVRNGARFIATNHDPTFPSEHGLLPGGGSIVAAVATASETEPVYAGKPNTPMAQLALSRLGSGGLMIGDRNDTDGLFARRTGYRFGLVLSGVTSREMADALAPSSRCGRRRRGDAPSHRSRRLNGLETTTRRRTGAAIAGPESRGGPPPGRGGSCARQRCSRNQARPAGRPG